MQTLARTKVRYFAHDWRQTSVVHRFPIVLVELVYFCYLCVRTDDITHFLCVTVLMVIHVDLYMLGTRTTFYAPASLPYLLAQSLLILAISALTGQWLIELGLSLALVIKVGELLEHAQPGPGPLLACALSYGLAAGLVVMQAEKSVDQAAWLTCWPFLVCAFGTMLLFWRQARARTCMQQLLHNLHDGYDRLFSARTELINRCAQLEASVVEAEEAALLDERRRLARELHDTLTQDLAGLILQLEAIEACLASSQPQNAYELVRQARERARVTLSETRRAIHDLRADAPERDSLVEVIQAEMERFSQATGILCRGDLRSFTVLSPHAGEQIVRGIKEGLTNIARHAHARVVWLGLRQHGREYVVELRDDGRGFDPAQVVAGHYGLPGLRERLQQLGGELSIQSAPGAGTCLRMRLPRASVEREVCAV